MSLIFISQIVLNGLIKGVLYALIASGFSFIYGQANVLFLGIGQIYMLGAVLCYVLMVFLKLPYLLAILIVFFTLGLVGILIDRFIFRYMETKEGSNQLTYALSSFLLGMFIVGVTTELFGGRTRSIVNPFQGVIDIYGVILPIDKLVVVCVSIGILVAFQLFFLYTRSGRAIRAMAQDSDAAQLSGIEVNHTKSLAFFLSMGVCGAAGALIAPLFYVGVAMGDLILTSTLIVVVLGGLGSFSGAILGGLSFGMMESFGQTFLGGITTILSFVLVMIVLIIRPKGLLGHD